MIKSYRHAKLVAADVASEPGTARLGTDGDRLHEDVESDLGSAYPPTYVEGD